ncbi:MAG: uncharacterized protein A8A55_3353, partial [Amphiamblys sp. WSBS2006]
HAVNLLPKLILPEDNIVEKLFLNGSAMRQLTEILQQDKKIWLGKIKNIELENSAVDILFKLRLPEDNVLEMLEVYACNKRCFTELSRQPNASIWLGRIKSIKLVYYAVVAITKLLVPEDNVVERLEVSADEQEHCPEILQQPDESIWLGRIKNIDLKNQAARYIFKIARNNEIEGRELRLDGETHQEILAWVCGAKRLALNLDSLSLLPDMLLSGSEIEKINIRSIYGGDMLEKKQDDTFKIGMLQKLSLWADSIWLLPKIQVEEGQQIEHLEIKSIDETDMETIYRKEDKSRWDWKFKNKTI